MDYLSCGNPTHHQARDSKLCEAYCPLAQHQCQNDLDSFVGLSSDQHWQRPQVGHVTRMHTVVLV